MALVSDTLPARLLSCRPGEEEAGVFELYDQKNTNGQVCMHACMHVPPQPTAVLLDPAPECGRSQESAVSVF